MELSFISQLYSFAKDILNILKEAVRWWSYKRPACRVFGDIAKNNTTTNIFIKDLIVPDNTLQTPKLISREGDYIQQNPNITEVIPEVEVTGVAKLLNVLGDIGKVSNFNIQKMSTGYDILNTNLIVLGAQSMKSLQFYEVMDNVGYKVDERHIYKKTNNEILPMDSGYGYGLIVKAVNGCLPNKQKGTAILLGGFGVLGTEAAIEYFCKNIALLGREFGNKSFSIVVRASITAGYQSVKRLSEYDLSFPKEEGK